MVENNTEKTEQFKEVNVVETTPVEELSPKQNVETQDIFENVLGNEQESPQLEENNKKATPEVVSEKDIQIQEKDPIIVKEEEKIAEMLPADEKVEIKVSVKEDKVTTFDERPKVATQVASAVDEIMEGQEDKVSLESQVSTEKTEVENPIIETKTKETTQVSIPVVSQQKEVVSITEQSIKEVEPLSVVAAANEVKSQEIMTKAETANSYQDKGITREVAEQIKVNITQSAIKGVDKIEIQLKPANLGQVEIKLHITKDSKIQAQIIASNAETLEILEKESSLLKDAFANAGYQMEDGSFSFSYRGEGQENEREKMREFIGEVITHDVAEEMAANDYISEEGVNIRV